MVAPISKSLVVPVTGLAPFVYGKDEVQDDPNKHFFRSLWTYNGYATDLPSVASSFRRVITFESALDAGLPVDPLFALVDPIYPGQERRSALSTRHFIGQNLVDDTSYAHNDNYFVGITKFVPGILEPRDFVKASIDWAALGLAPAGTQEYAAPPIGAALQYNARYRESNTADKTGVDFIPMAASQLSMQLRYGDNPAYYTLPAWPYSTAAVFTTDGTDGNAPQLLSSGRTVDEQIAYMQDPIQAQSLYLGVGFQVIPTETTNGIFCTASIGHSISITNS